MGGVFFYRAAPRTIPWQGVLLWLYSAVLSSSSPLTVYMNKLTRTILSWAAMAVVLAILLFGMDVAFRLYERTALVEDVAETAGPFDLTELGYHHHGPPISRSLPANATRILSLGDSFAYAITIPSLTYAAMAERSLATAAKACPGETGVEVLNLGVPAISFPEYLRQARFWSSMLEFDALVLNIYAGNDFINVQGTMVDPAALRPQPLQVGLATRVPHKYPLRFMDYIFALAKTAQMDAAAPSEMADDYDPRLAGMIPDAKYKEIMQQSARIYAPALLPEFQTSLHWCYEALRFAAEMAKQGKPVCVLVSPPHFLFEERWLEAVREDPGLANVELDPSLPGEVVRRLAVQAGLDVSMVVDLTPEMLRQAAHGETLYLGTNTHWTVAGNQVAADAMAATLLPALKRQWGCADAPPPVSAETFLPHPHGDTIDDAIDSIKEAQEFNTSVLAPLAATAYAREQDLRQALQDLGYSEDAKVLGLVDTVHKGGERRNVWLEGWVLDTKAPSTGMRVLAFLDGALIGSGVVSRERPDVAQRHNVPPEQGARFGFHFQVAAPASLRDSDAIWVVAVSDTMTYAHLQTDGWTERSLSPGE